MDSAQLVVTVLGAGGGGAALLALINGFYKWLNGSAGRERDKNTSLVSQRKNAIQERDAAERERDDADKKRREAFEYVSLLRRQLIEAGLEPVPQPIEGTANTPGGPEMALTAPTKSRYIGDAKPDDEQP
jgi:hypothetical protein